MGYNRSDPVLNRQPVELGQIIRIKCLGPASAGISGKKLKNIRTDINGLLSHCGVSFAERQMTADLEHKIPLQHRNGH